MSHDIQIWVPRLKGNGWVASCAVPRRENAEDGCPHIFEHYSDCVQACEASNHAQIIAARERLRAANADLERAERELTRIEATFAHFGIVLPVI